jgi:hypothetical protein
VALGMLGKCSIIELHPQPESFYFFFFFFETESHYVAQAGPKLCDGPASASLMLRDVSLHPEMKVSYWKDKQIKTVRIIMLYVLFFTNIKNKYFCVVLRFELRALDLRLEPHCQ